jgi:hypothetical protein
VQAELNMHKADYAYQTPIIVGTQIQMQQQSDNNRLYFKLDSDLSGGAITISLDNGATQLPLLDIEGQPVTEISKGFVEVIKDAVNFTLRPRGVGMKFTEGDNLISISDTERSTTSSSYVKVKEFLINTTGIYRIKFDLRSSIIGYNAYGRIYKNGVAFGTQRSNSGNYVSFTEDLQFSKGDTCELWISQSVSGGTCFAKNFRLYVAESPTLILD